MGIVVTFRDYTPAARVDGNPWTAARIEEAVSALGPWDFVETLTFGDPDPDPSTPASRDFTTTQGTLDPGWYRVVFLDDVDGVQATEARYFGATSLAGLPSWLRLDELKARIDRENVDEELLAGFLVAAFAQAQEAPPYGCGRVLLPDPGLVDGSDTGSPVERELPVFGRTVLVPDARAITAVLGSADAVLSEGDDYGNYRALRHKGVVVALRLASGRRTSGYRLAWPNDSNWPTTIKVTGRFGFVSVEQNLVEAIYTLAGRMYFERDAQYSDQVRVAEGAVGEAYFRQLPVRTKLAFQTYAVPAAYAGLA